MSRWELPPKGGHMELPTVLKKMTSSSFQLEARKITARMPVPERILFLSPAWQSRWQKPPAVRSLNRSGMDPIPFIIWGCPVPSSFLKKILQPIFGRLSPDFGTPASESRFYSTVTGRIM